MPLNHRMKKIVFIAVDSIAIGAAPPMNKSSAFPFKATGYSFANAAVKTAVGCSGKKLSSDAAGRTCGWGNSTLGYIVVQFSRRSFCKRDTAAGRAASRFAFIKRANAPVRRLQSRPVTYSAEQRQYAFTKMEGTGNDYIYFDCFRQEVPAPESFVEALSHRRFGIGGDGVVLICPSGIADAEMRMFNADGSEGLMCGNAIRCVGKYLYDSGIARRETITVATCSGVKELVLYPQNGMVESAMVKMGAPEFLPQKIPVRLSGERIIGRAVQVAGSRREITCVSMGNPHCVVFCEDPERVPLERIGPEFERDSLFPKGVNTEFVRVESSGVLRMRVWERGSGETLACGTGACAAVVAAVENGFCEKGREVAVKLRGGNLMIRYTDEDVFLTGAARKVFEGTIEI